MKRATREKLAEANDELATYEQLADVEAEKVRHQIFGDQDEDDEYDRWHDEGGR